MNLYKFYESYSLISKRVMYTSKGKQTHTHTRTINNFQYR